MAGIKTTGNSQIDGATAEIAGHVRDGRVGSHVKYREQDHYDEAMRLRDEILHGAEALQAIRHPCPDGGTCHHSCEPGACFRVHWAGPLSNVYPGDEWPAGVKASYAEGGHL